MNLLQLYQKLEALDVEKAASDAVEETKEAYSDANRKQLHEGFDSKGNRLRPYRSAKYARVKNEMNPLPGLGNPDLFVTGAFASKIQTNVTGQTITTESTDGKSMKLEGQYGPDIYGIGGKFKTDYVNDSLRPVWKRKVESLTGLKYK